jgi:alanine racemase
VSRWAWVEVSADAIRRNTTSLVELVAPAQLWAVVKADGYGHGSVAAARAALSGGATGLCVALVQEGVVLREAGVTNPILVLSEQPPEELPMAVRHGLQLTVYSVDQLRALEDVGAVSHPVHLKVDTGMQRVGVPASRAVEMAGLLAASPAVDLVGVFTHLAMADSPDDPFTERQLDRFDLVLRDLAMAGHRPPLVHAANSAGAIAHRRARYDMVRSGIAVYGISPGEGVDELVEGLGLLPALSLHTRVSHVKSVAAGAGISYGLRHRFPADTNVATLPIGYADGVPRRLHAAGGEVLVHGRRCPIVGVVTMDQLMVDVGDLPVRVGDPAVLLGGQDDHTITAAEWAGRLDTIAYEIVCGLSSRLERRPV